MMDNPIIGTVDENAPMLSDSLSDKGVSGIKRNTSISKKPHSAKKSNLRTPLASRNINTPSSAQAVDRGHIARTNAQGDIVIYSPAFILKKEATASAASGANIIIEDLDVEHDLSVTELDFEQFRKRNLSSLGLTMVSPISEGAIAPKNTPADDSEQDSPPTAGQGELLMAKTLQLSTNNTPNTYSFSKQSMSNSRRSASTASSTGISPVHFSRQGLTPLVGTPSEKSESESEITKRMEELEDRFAKQELAHQQERATFQSMIEKLTSQVEILNSRLSESP